MHFRKSSLAAAATLSATLALLAAPLAAAASVPQVNSNGLNPTRPQHAALARRGPISDIVHILQNKKQTGQAFCSTFLHLPPYAATKTVTSTETITKTSPASTTTRATVLTKTASSAVTVVKSNTVIVAVTPTTQITVPSAVPSTSTVTTVTSVDTATTTVVQTVTSYTIQGRNAQNRPHDPSRTRLPYWLNQYSCPQVSKACSRVVTAKTKTVTKTATATRTVRSGAASVGITSTTVITPTSTVVDTVTSTSTAAAVTATVVTPSSSLVPATATVVSTVVSTVTATEVITLPTVLPTPSARILIRRASDNSFFGYVRAQLDEGNSYMVTSSTGDALVIQVPQPGGPQNIPAPGDGFPYLGAIYQPLSAPASDLSSSTSAYIFLGRTAAVAPGSQSTDFTQNSHYTAYQDPASYQSAVWTYDATSGSLTLTWTNSNGDSFQPTLTTTNGYIIYAGNLDQYFFDSQGVLVASLELI
ncbi:hypothetical protein OC844_004471 [Tilletia horrida]|nr:hypothetical protein OC844_004471 [Tilletia horrida]